MASASAIDAYLRRHKSPLAGYGQAFVSAGQRYRIPPGLLVAIAGAESSFGHINSGHFNPFGWGPGIDFPNYQTAISTIAKGLRANYFNQGLTSVSAIASKWAPSGASNDPTNLNSNWVRNVKKFMGELGGSMPPGANVSPVQPTGGLPALPGPNTSSGNVSSLPEISLQSLSHIGSGNYDPLKSLSALTASVQAGASAAAPGIEATLPSPTGAPTSGHYDSKWLKIGAGADRAGVHTHNDILNFATAVAHAYGSPLTVGTGTNHNQYVAGTHRQSAHWIGEAVDIPMSGAALTRLGQAALIAAGMNPAQARRTHGGLFNIGGYQIIFNSNIGGNHYNHLHLGRR